MNRGVVTTNFGEDRERHVARIESDLCEEGDFRALVTMLQTVSMYQPDLLRHIGSCPTEGRFFWDHGRWVLESVTITQKPARE